MKLSVIIVNYNVKYFLEQCLNSVRKAIQGIGTEIFVVDNNSVDGSIRMLREKFPEVIPIENKNNLGFSKANNQAIKRSSGEYILLLNPDTVVEDDTFTKCVEFMDEHPDAGGLGVKMIDGKGNFLPESKRGFPSPIASFSKMFGLSKLFPHSKIFGKYHLSYLDKDKIHQVDVLAGAFMMLRKSALEKTGLLDEAFFMYGEDIDLSYRIIQAGYKNYYFPKTRIIHYKGESTKKSSVNYVFIFYNAMVIFAKKHLTKQNARIFTFLINLAIYLRASIAIINRFFNKAFLPLLDTSFLYLGLLVIKGYWEAKVIFPQGGHYPDAFIYLVLPAYIIIWLLGIFLSGGYDRPIKLFKIPQGIIIGTLIILVFYALLPESWRFSRAIILLGAAWGMTSMIVIRLILNSFHIKGFEIGEPKSKRFLIVGKSNEANRVKSLLKKTQLNAAFVGLVNPGKEKEKNNEYIGNLSQIRDIVTIYNIDEIIFCSKNVSLQKIIDNMSELYNTQVDYKIAPEDSFSIIGSNSINTSGDLYIIDINSINRIANKRHKRLFDILVSLIFIPLLPILIFILKQPGHFIKNIVKVLMGYKTWVGYYSKDDVSIEKLPAIPPGVLHPGDVFKNKRIAAETYEKLNLIYARDYKFITDMNILIKGLLNLGRK